MVLPKLSGNIHEVSMGLIDCMTVQNRKMLRKPMTVAQHLLKRSMLASRVCELSPVSNVLKCCLITQAGTWLVTFISFP